MQGHTEGDGDSYHTAPNYAKLAYLVLNKGVWGGEQLLDPTYIAGPGGILDLDFDWILALFLRRCCPCAMWRAMCILEARVRGAHVLESLESSVCRLNFIVGNISKGRAGPRGRT